VGQGKDWAAQERIMEGNERLELDGVSTDAPTISVEGHFVGREADLDTLVAAFGRVSEHGTTELVCVTGRPGYGKTTLLERFSAELIHGVVAYGRYEGLRSRPYAGIAHALGELVRHMLSLPEAEYRQWVDDIDRRLGTSAEALITLVPDLEQALGKREPVAIPHAETTLLRLHQAVLTLVASIAERAGPVAFSIDDIHWAEPASIDLLDSLR
jgi:predicted ATPase